MVTNNDIIDQLKQPPPPMMVPGCTTCRHLYKQTGMEKYTSHWSCSAVGGDYATTAYKYQCKGAMWEPHPPPPPFVPVLVRLKRWLVG